MPVFSAFSLRFRPCEAGSGRFPSDASRAPFLQRQITMPHFCLFVKRIRQIVSHKSAAALIAPAIRVHARRAMLRIAAQHEVAGERPPPTASGGAKRAAYWNTGLVRVAFLVACSHRLQASLFQSFQEAFRSLQSSFKRLPNISLFFQKISIDFPESGLINGLKGERAEKINEGAVDRGSAPAPACSSFLPSSFRFLLSKRRAGAIFTIADGVL